MAGAVEDVKTIRVDVKPHGDRELKIVWNDSPPWPSYNISRAAVETAARRIRDALRDLVQAALDGTLAVSGERLKNLARAGSVLHETLFAATEHKDYATRVRRYYSNPETEPFRLRFSVETSVFVPWGLVYPASPDEVEGLPVLDNIAAPGPYAEFWCISRELATIYDRIAQDAAGRGYASSHLGIMRVVNGETFEAVKAGVKLASEVQLLEWLEAAAPPIRTVKDLRRAWKGQGATTGLLYFYCHANATKLALSDVEQLESSDLLVTLSGAPREQSTSGCLLVINGCSTAVGDPKGDFMVAASQEGLCGFIGTEADVPDIFALRFSLALLDLLFREGLTVSAAMLRLYQSHFPLSLLYGLYAHPDFSMPKAGMPAPAGAPNLSLEPVGTRRLRMHDAAR
jgi:hypothetical protein